MDAPLDLSKIDRAALDRLLAEVEAKWPMRFLGIVPPEKLPFPRAPRRLNLLAAVGEMSLLDFVGIEIELGQRFGHEISVVPTGSEVGAKLIASPAIAAE